MGISGIGSNLKSQQNQYLSQLDPQAGDKF